MRIVLGNLENAAVHALLAEHLTEMRKISPPESVHALDIEALKANNIRFWTLWEGSELLGCGALKELDSRHGEIKSMRTSMRQRRRGVARKMLEHIIQYARAQGYERLSLETGSMPHFQPAHALYQSYGFTLCVPFANYQPDPNSLCMTLELGR